MDSRKPTWFHTFFKPRPYSSALEGPTSETVTLAADVCSHLPNFAGLIRIPLQAQGNCNSGYNPHRRATTPLYLQ